MLLHVVKGACFGYTQYEGRSKLGVVCDVMGTGFFNKGEGVIIRLDSPKSVEERLQVLKEVPRVIRPLLVTLQSIYTVDPYRGL